MYEAHLQYGYTLKDIAEYIGIYYTTVSRAIKKIEREYEKWYCKIWPHNPFKEGSARRIIIKNEKGEVVVEFPLTAGAVGLLLAPALAALGAIAALLTKCTLIVERKE